jgi:TRAP-type C4-dicarboxylate transport system permease small subunit
MAGIPMWIPHGMVALGFGLILIVALRRLVGIVRRTEESIPQGEAKP